MKAPKKKVLRKYPLPTDTPKMVEEAAVTYTKSYLGVLKGMSPHEIATTALPGTALTELQEELNLSAQNIADILGISKSKYYDLLKLHDIGVKNLDALADFAQVWQKGLEAFDGDQNILNEWLQLKNKSMGMVTPESFLGSRIGRRELEKAFHRIEFSLYG